MAVAGEPGGRILVIGNSGSGKSTLARALAEAIGASAVDLDLLHWEDAGFGRKRDEDAARVLAHEAAKREHWVIEGVYGWLADAALPRASALVWLDLPWPECRAGLLARGRRRGANDVSFRELLRWGEDYWRRETSSSFAGHRIRFDAFTGAKWRFTSRAAIDEFIAAISGRRARAGD